MEFLAVPLLVFCIFVANNQSKEILELGIVMYLPVEYYRLP